MRLIVGVTLRAGTRRGRLNALCDIVNGSVVKMVSHKGLKIPRTKVHVGSNPTGATVILELINNETKEIYLGSYNHDDWMC